MIINKCIATTDSGFKSAIEHEYEKGQRTFYINRQTVKGFIDKRSNGIRFRVNHDSKRINIIDPKGMHQLGYRVCFLLKKRVPIMILGGLPKE